MSHFLHRERGRSVVLLVPVNHWDFEEDTIEESVARRRSGRDPDLRQNCFLAMASRCVPLWYRVGLSVVELSLQLR